MPATTDKLKLPYPLPTDPIADGANQIKELAEAIENKLLKIKKIDLRVSEKQSSGSLNDYIGEVAYPDGFTRISGVFVSFAVILNSSQSAMIFKYHVTDSTIKVFGSGNKGIGNFDVPVLVWGY